MNSVSGFFMLLMMVVFSAYAEDTTMKKNSVLLSFEDTKFKNALIKEMKKRLEKDGITVVVVNHTNGGTLADYTATDFNAVFITNSGINSKVRPWVLEWLKKNEQVASRIILHTTQIRKWEVNTPVKVDAITSASANSKLKSLAAEYIIRLKSLIKSSQGPS